jgi:hypothetical protein
MKALNSITTFAMLAVFSAATAFANMPRRGAAVFSDGFDAIGTFAENWGKPHGKVKSEDGRMVANAIGTVTQATPARTAPLDILVEGSIAILDEGRRVGWTGFSLDGYLFLLTSRGSSWLNLNNKLKSADNGKCVRVGGYKTGDSVKLTVVRRKRGGSCEYSFYVNGIPAGIFAAPVPEKPAMPVFSTYDLKSTLDDVGVYALADENASPNLISNASVEHDRDGIPSMFARPGMYEFDKGPSEGYERDFLTGFGVDKNEAHSGRQSLFLTVGPYHGGSIQPFNAGTVKGAAGVFSVYMKASLPGVAVKLEYAGKSKTVRLTTEWARYEVANPSLKGKGIYSPVSVSIVKKESPEGKFTVWMDDFQAEIVDLPEGGFKDDATYASPFRVADSDAVRYGPKELIVRPHYDVPELPQGIIPSLDLDAWCEHAAVGGEFQTGPRAAKLQTRLQLACDKSNLYVGMRCEGEPAANLTAEPLLTKGSTETRDVLSLYMRDSIELFLSPTQEKKWFHLMATANEQQTDLWSENIAWNGKWKLETKAVSGGVDYFVTIPAEDFASPDLKDTWFANFCRKDAANKESSCVYPVKVGTLNYRDIQRWAELSFPHDVATAWRGVKGSTVVEKKAEGVKVVGRLNYYMDEPEAKFRITKSGKTEEFSLDIRNLPVGTNTVTVGGEKAEVIKYAYDPEGVQINRFALCLERHGRKLLPFAIMVPHLDFSWVSPECRENMARFFGETGFKYLRYTAALQKNSPNMEASMDALMKVCDEFGMLRFHSIKYFNTTTPGMTQEAIAAKMETNAMYFARWDVKSVIGTIVVDEPELWMKSEDCYRYLKSLRPFYPTRPMIMNNTIMGIPNDYARLETDILMLDDYLTVDEVRTIASMMENIDAMTKKGCELARPSFVYVVSANYPLQPCEPTYAQQIAQCYAVLASGVNGVVLWGLIPPATPGNWRAVKQLAKEFAVLENMILTEEPPPAVECAADRAKIRFRPAVKDGTLTLLTCNIDEQRAGKVVFNLPPPFSAASEAEVLFENRKVKIENGAIADEFAGYARHVYSVKSKE